jgi:hypothetical protein
MIFRFEKFSVWQNFFGKDEELLEKAPESDLQVKCKHCSKKYQYVKKNGSSGLKKHLDNCKGIVPKGQTKLIVGKNVDVFKTSYDVSRKYLGELILEGELSFRFVELSVLSKLLKSFDPQFKVPNKDTIIKDFMGYVDTKMVNVKKIVSESLSRASFTNDLWTSKQDLPFKCITGKLC